MTDLVQKLVALIEEAPHYFAPQHDFDGKKAEWFNAQRAALSTAKDGGWVAVPVEPTPEMLKAGETAYWQKVRDVQSPTPTEFYDECGGPIGYAWIAMLAARSLPNPPKEQNT